MSRNHKEILFVGGCLALAGCLAEPGELGDQHEAVQPAHEEGSPLGAMDLGPEAVDEANPWYGLEPYVIATEQDGARNLALSGDRVFWIANDGITPVLHQSDVNGHHIAVHLAFEATPNAAVAIDGVPYWEAAGGLFRITDDSFAVEKLTSFGSETLDLAARDADLFVATADGCVTAKAEGADDFETLACGAAAPMDLVAHADGVWWSAADGYIYRADLGVAEPVVKAGMDGNIAVDHDDVYWTQDNEIWKASRVGSGEPSQVIVGQGTIINLINDRFFLYYTVKENGSVWQFDKNAGSSRLLSTGWGYPDELILVGHNRLFWVDGDAGLIVTQRLY